MGKEFALTGTDGRTVARDEEELLEACRQGSAPAFERLYEEQGARMKSIAMNLLGNASDAEDAVQETFLRVHRSVSSFRSGSSFATWVYRILLNCCYDLMRKSRRRAEGPLPARLAHSAAGETDHPLRLSIENALRRLDPKERAAFLLCEVEGFSHRETGDILGVSEAASRTLLFRARRQLQRELRAGGAFAEGAAS